MKYKLRQAARNDLKDIGRYTLKYFGKIQRDRYLTGLSDRFVLLGESPNFGRTRNDIKNGYHSGDYKKHVVFYIIQKGYVDVLAVLHESMVPEHHL